MNAQVTTLKASSDFQRLSRVGKKFHFPAFIMLLSQREGEGFCRVGYTVSRKVGNAVQRNRAKRRLREAVRLAFKDYAGVPYDLVLIAKASAVERDFSLMVADLQNALRQMAGVP